MYKRQSPAIILINRPDLLILDEPTNHLDLEMIEWLESYFTKENITLFMVTHDRFFLERVCNEIIELDNGKLYQYKGNYSYYFCLLYTSDAADDQINVLISGGAGA